MSRTDANTEKTAGPLQNVARPDNLHWDVFVTPGLPGSSNRPDNTSAISIDQGKPQQPPRSCTTRCWSDIRTGSIPDGRYGDQHAQSSLESGDSRNTSEILRPQLCGRENQQGGIVSTIDHPLIQGARTSRVPVADLVGFSIEPLGDGQALGCSTRDHGTPTRWVPCMAAFCAMWRTQRWESRSAPRCNRTSRSPQCR